MTGQLVLVTGAGGFVAAHVVQQLQQAGYRVRGSLRRLDDRDRVEALRKLVPDAKHELELVKADLTSDEGWDSAVSDCWAVMHVASPMPSMSSDMSEEDYRAPAVDGSLRVLRAASRAGVRKVVITGEFAAVVGVPIPYEEGKVYTEEDWTDTLFPKLHYYAKAKTLAEKTAWNFVETLPEDRKLELTVLLPGGALGPPLLKPPLPLTGNVEVIHQLMIRAHPGSPNLHLAFSDVRDVAAAHVKSLTTPAAVHQRVIIVSRPAWLPEVASTLSTEFGPQGYSVSTRTLPALLLWLPAMFDKRLARTGIFDRIGQQVIVDSSKMKNIFGIEARDLHETILDMAYTMIDLGVTYKAEMYRQVGSRALSPPSHAS